MTESDIYAVLEAALKETQRGSSENTHTFSTSLAITGKDSIFDSLDTMLFLDHVDDMLTAKTGKTVTVVTDDVFSRDETPFRTMKTLAEHIAIVCN